VGQPSGRYLTFTLGGEIYAVSILEVSEIIEFRTLTVVPMMPSYIRGVVNLRGRVLPVVDLAARFGQQPTIAGRRTGIIVVELVDRPAESEAAESSPGVQGIGIMVDAVNKVVHLDEGDIEPVPAFGTGIRSDFISGMAKYDDGFIVVLGIEKVLSLDEMAMVGQVAIAASAGPVGEIGSALVAAGA
jgi:purine-binding chemotaxis protein CheW